jgi:rhodanese-related sulfurtransferase
MIELIEIINLTGACRLLFNGTSFRSLTLSCRAMKMPGIIGGKMKNIAYLLTLTLVFIMGTAASALSADYRYVSRNDFKQWLESGKKMIIVDIQPPADFAKGHFRGAIETNAYPVKTEQEKQRIDKTLKRIDATPDDIVIVCPRGGGGAKKTSDYLKTKGVSEARMYILEKGSEGWPYPEMCVTGDE